MHKMIGNQFRWTIDWTVIFHQISHHFMNVHDISCESAWICWSTFAAQKFRGRSNHRAIGRLWDAAFGAMFADALQVETSLNVFYTQFELKWSRSTWSTPDRTVASMYRWGVPALVFLGVNFNRMTMKRAREREREVDTYTNSKKTNIYIYI